MPGQQLNLPGLSVQLAVCQGAGIALRSPGEALELRFGQPGERIALVSGRRPPRVRDLLREQGIPPWLRPRFPLVYRGPDLLAVGSAVALTARAEVGRVGVLPEIQWVGQIL